MPLPDALRPSITITTGIFAVADLLLQRDQGFAQIVHVPAARLGHGELRRLPGAKPRVQGAGEDALHQLHHVHLLVRRPVAVLRPLRGRGSARRVLVVLVVRLRRRQPGRAGRAAYGAEAGEGYGGCGRRGLPGGRGGEILVVLVVVRRGRWAGYDALTAGGGNGGRGGEILVVFVVGRRRPWAGNDVNGRRRGNGGRGCEILVVLVVGAGAAGRRRYETGATGGVYTAAERAGYTAGRRRLRGGSPHPPSSAA